jgi:hypothetical protein
MKKQIILGIVFSALVLVLSFAGSKIIIADNTYNGITNIQQGEITSADLGVDNVGRLPTSSFYFLKEWGRGIDRLFTWRASSRVKLELEITNQIAAELLEVIKVVTDDNTEKESLTKVGQGQLILDNALKNFINSQERLNARLVKFTAINGNMQISDLTQKIDEANAKYATVINQGILNIQNANALGTTIVSSGATLQLDNDLVLKAEDNILKTFTITFTGSLSLSGTGISSTGAETANLKATAAITSAEQSIKKTETTLGQTVTFTATINVQPVNDAPSSINNLVSIGGLDIKLTHIPAGWAEFQPLDKDTTGSDGSFEFTGLSAGTYKLSIAGQIVDSLTIGTEGTIGGIIYISTADGGAWKSHTITAVYNGDANFKSATSGFNGTLIINGSISDETIILNTDTTIGIDSGSQLKNISGNNAWAGDITLLANAKSHLKSAKELLAAGKYAEAYGLARLAEAMVTGISVAVGDVNADGFDDKTAPTPTPAVTPKTLPKPSPKAPTLPTTKPTSEKPKPVCEHAAPPEGCHYEGSDIYPVCGAYLVCATPTQTSTEDSTENGTLGGTGTIGQ